MTTMECGRDPVRFFAEVDRVTPGIEGGVLCRPVSPKRISSFDKENFAHVFLVNLGGNILAVEKKQFKAFLTRNPNLDRGLSPKPEDIFCKILRDRTPSPLPVSPPLSPPPSPNPSCRGSLWREMEKSDPSESNIFLYFLKHRREFDPKTLEAGGARYPFAFLNRILSACPSTLPVEGRALKFRELLLKQISLPAQKKIVDSLGLQESEVVEKIVRDLVEYLYARSTPALIFSDAFDESLKKELQLEIRQLVERCKDGDPGCISRTHIAKFSQKLLECKKIASNQYEVSFFEFRPLSDEKKISLVDALTKLGMNSSDIEKILLGLGFEWQGFYDYDKSQPDLFRQTHQIKGVKIFKHRTGQVVADIAIAPLARGQRKTAKRKFTLLPDGTLVENNRYTALGKDDSAREMFLADIAQELAIRELLGKEPIPNLLDIYVSGMYLNKDSQIKTRFESLLCRGSLDELIYSKDIKTSYTPLPLHERQTLRALSIAYKVLKALCAMHEVKAGKESVVHKDIKLENVLYMNGDEGLLSDLGFATLARDKYVDFKTPEYSPPECIWSKDLQKNDPRSDVFSFGVLLLFIYLPELRSSFFTLQERAFDFSESKGLSEGQYKRLLEQFRHDLRASPLGNFIADLMHPELEQRPTSEQAFARFTELLPSLRHDPKIVGSVART